MSDRQTIDLRDYLGVLRRRRKPFLLTTAGLLLIGFTVAVMWPATYRSTATILIEEQDIPADLMRSAVSSSAAQRIQTISQQVMTRANLMKVVEKFDIYAEARQDKKFEKIVESMRKRIKIETVSANVTDPRSGRPSSVAIAFTVAFEHGKGEIAQKVAQELVNLFLERNTQVRTAKASDSLRFLTAEAQTLSKQIAGLETSLAAFKGKNVTSLPELKELNLRLMDHVERQITTVDSQVRELKERKFALEGELAKISPWNPMISPTGQRVVDPVTMLRTLRAEYVGAAARYSQRHPDVVRLQREIKALEKQVGSTGAAKARLREIARLKGQLAVTADKYSNDHPDVVKLRRAIGVLEVRTRNDARNGIKPLAALPTGFDADNPAYITLNARLKAVTSGLDSLVEMRRQLDTKLTEYGQRITQSPQIERDYLSLGREYDSAIRRYREIKDKQVEARVRRDLEADHAEHFSLIDPPQLPDAPVKPNRALIMLFGCLFALTGGLGGAGLAEALGKQPPPDRREAELADAERRIAELEYEIDQLREEPRRLPTDGGAARRRSRLRLYDGGA